MKHKIMEGETKNSETQAAAGGGVTAAALVLLQFLQVGLNIVVGSAIARGMSICVFIVYSNAVALCFLLPSTFFFHRKRSLPSMSQSIVWKILLLSLLRYAAQLAMYTGIFYSSPTLASAFDYLTPAFTFVSAILSGMEKLDLKLPSSKAKGSGTVICIVGAVAATIVPFTNISFLNRGSNGKFLLTPSNWLIGSFIITSGSFFLSLSFVVQTSIMEDYPAELMVTTISCIFALIPSTMLALVAESNPKAWIFKSHMEIIAILYSAIFVTSMGNVVNAWACRNKGPLYVAIFNPLGIIVALCLGVIFLGDTLYLESVIGAVIIAAGFYAVRWGQAQEEKNG